MFFFSSAQNNEDGDDESWRHAFLIERGKMTASRYHKIQQRDENSRLETNDGSLFKQTLI